MSDYAVMENIPAWVTQLFVAELPSHQELKQDLLAVITQVKQQQQQAVESDVAITAKQSLYESTLDFLNNEQAAVQSLKQHCEEAVLLAATEANANCWPENSEVKVETVESWFHVTSNGGYHDAHSHPNCSWCGIYYLEPAESSLDNRNGVNRFYDPRINAEHYLDAGSQYLNSEGVWDIEPVEGQLIIFPSYLKHSALPYIGDKERVVIAFNCQLHFVEA